MAFKSKDGSRNFGNRQQAKAYDERPPKKDAKAMPAENEQGEGGEENSPQDIHEMVAQHGPAEKVEISHAEGKHTKVSHHGGKSHKSEHASAAEAHHAGMTAAGVEPGESDEQPAAPGAGAMQEGGIPGM